MEWLLDGVSFRLDFIFFCSSLSRFGAFSVEGMWCRFWFLVSRDLLWLLEDGLDWSFLEEPGHSSFAKNKSVKSPPFPLLDSESDPELLPKLVSDSGPDPGWHSARSPSPNGNQSLGPDQTTCRSDQRGCGCPLHRSLVSCPEYGNPLMDGHPLNVRLRVMTDTNSSSGSIWLGVSLSNNAAVVYRLCSSLLMKLESPG